MSSSDLSGAENRYVIDIEQAAETARLIEQDKLFTRAMGGLFPEEPDLSGVSHVLDLACGPGNWPLEVAYQYPSFEVVGVDINPTIIEYAFAQARVRGIQNANFEVMDVLKPLEFADESFDLVNARLIFGFMDKVSWPELLAECWRILRPGGLIRLTEIEGGPSTSFAAQRLGRYFTQALIKQGRTFSVDDCSLGITHVLARLLREAGFDKIKRKAFVIDSSYGSEMYSSNYKNTEVAFKLLKPYMVRSGMVEEGEFDELYKTMLLDIARDDYAALLYGLTACATKAVQK